MAKIATVVQHPSSRKKIRIDELVGQYVQIRDRIAEIKEEQKQQLEPFNEVYDKLKMRILAFLDQTGQESARTTEGTVTKSSYHSAALHTPNEFMDFVFKYNLPELLDRKANANACIDYANEHGQLPPGVSINSIRTLKLTRARITS